MNRIVTMLIRFYQVCVSPIFGPSCRFYPSCSHYALEAIKRFGLIKGSYLAIRRLSKCHPYHEGGVDLVPELTKTSCCEHHINH